MKMKFTLFRGVGRGGREENCPKMLFFFFFHGKRHDNKILKVQIILSRNFVVMAQAPKNSKDITANRKECGVAIRIVRF